MKKKIAVFVFLVCFFMGACVSNQNYDEINVKLQELEELTVKYLFYKNYIVENNLSLNEYLGIFNSYIDEMEKIIDFLDLKMGKFDELQIEKCKLLTNILMKESSELNENLK
jgi:hypothetical protein